MEEVAKNNLPWFCSSAEPDAATGDKGRATPQPAPAQVEEGAQLGDRARDGQEEERLEGVERAKTQAQKERPSIKEEGDWEGFKSRPKQRTIESINKSKQRADKARRQPCDE